MQFLRDWLDKHIHKSDAAYAPYVKNQKVAEHYGTAASVQTSFATIACVYPTTCWLRAPRPGCS